MQKSYFIALLSKESGSGHLRPCLGLGALSFPQPCSTFGILPHHLCLCRKAAAAPCILIVSKPATEGRKWAFLQWLSSSLIQKLICPWNLRDLLLLSLAQMSAWLLMTQEASELLFDRGSPSQTRVHKKRTTGMSLSCWTGTLACDTQRPPVSWVKTGLKSSNS